MTCTFLAETRRRREQIHNHYLEMIRLLVRTKEILRVILEEFMQNCNVVNLLSNISISIKHDNKWKAIRSDK